MRESLQFLLQEKKAIPAYRTYLFFRHGFCAIPSFAPSHFVVQLKIDESGALQKQGANPIPTKTHARKPSPALPVQEVSKRHLLRRLIFYSPLAQPNASKRNSRNTISYLVKEYFGPYPCLPARFRKEKIGTARVIKKWAWRSCVRSIGC